MNQTKLEEYAVLNAQIKHLKNQQDELKVDIIADIITSGEQSVVTPVGQFTLSSRKTWTYTPLVSSLEEKFKAQKAIEESTGDATYTEKPSLRFTGIKL